jgi:hypothetical protein
LDQICGTGENPSTIQTKNSTFISTKKSQE